MLPNFLWKPIPYSRAVKRVLLSVQTKVSPTLFEAPVYFVFGPIYKGEKNNFTLSLCAFFYNLDIENLSDPAMSPLHFPDGEAVIYESLT